MEISKNLIDCVLKGYKPELKVLKSADLEYPNLEYYLGYYIFRGNFIVGPTYYYTPPFEHATDIEIQLCLNQLADVGIAEMMKMELIKELEGFKFEELQKENMLITESRKRFSRPIRTDKEIYGELRLKKWKDCGDILLGLTDFQFEDRSCFGSLEITIIKAKIQK